MNRKRRKIILLMLSFICIIPFPGLNGDSGGWRQVIDSDGIRIYTRAMPGSDIDECRGTMEINTRLEVLGDIMRDIPSQPLWIADSMEARELKRMNDHTVITYSIYRAPWPVMNRDAVIKAVYTTDLKKRSFSIEMSSADDVIPSAEGLVRISGLRGRWDFQEIGRGKVSVLYNIKFNPGGSIPAWLANRISTQSPFLTLKNLRRIASEKDGMLYK